MPTFTVKDFEDEETTEKTLSTAEVSNDDPAAGNDDPASPPEGEPSDDAGDDNAPAPESKRIKAKLADLDLDDEDLPEDLRGKIKSGKDLLDVFNNTRQFARDLYDKVGQEKEPASKKEETEPKAPLFTEDELGIGADVNAVENKLNKLVEEKTKPFVISALQKDSENHLRNLLNDEKNFPYAKRFQNELLALAGNLDLQLTARPGTWQNLYNQVVGANANVLLEELKKTAPPSSKPKAPASEKGNNGSSGEKGNRSTSSADADFEARVKSARLSPEQKNVAEAMGISEEAYIRRALKMGYELNGKL